MSLITAIKLLQFEHITVGRYFDQAEDLWSRVNEKYSKTKRDMKDVADKNKFTELTVEDTEQTDKIDNSQVISSNSGHTNGIIIGRIESDEILPYNSADTTWRKIKDHKDP